MSVSLNNNFFEKSYFDIRNELQFYRLVNNEINELNRLNESQDKFKKEYKLNDIIYDRIISEKTDKILSNIDFTLKTLNPERDEDILNLIQNCLGQLGTSLSLIEENISHWEKDEKLHVKVSDTVDQLVNLKRQFLSKEMERIEVLRRRMQEGEPLPLAEEVEREERVNASYSDLTMSLATEEEKQHSLIRSLWLSSPNFIFTPGRFYNPIPFLLTSYIQRREQDNPIHIEEILDLINGFTLDSPIVHSKGIGGVEIADKHGEYIDVPVQFALDLQRSREFYINGSCFYRSSERQDYNENEVARELYRNLGQLGGGRVMSLCNQAWTPLIVISQPLLRVIGNEENEFFQQYKKRFGYEPKNIGGASGLIHEVNFNADRVEITQKLIWKLSSIDDDGNRLPGIAEFVTKSTVILSKSELMAEKGVLNPHVEEMISTLIFNNHQEAEELFRKI